MKKFCARELPIKDGSFQTNSGYLDFHVKPYGWHGAGSWTISNMLIQEFPLWWEDKEEKLMTVVKDIDLEEKRRIIRNNILLSVYLFGPAKDTVPLFMQIGHANGGHKLYRRLDDLASNQPNFHNSFDILAPVICKIAKEYYKCEAFSTEEVKCEEIKDALFEFAYDPMIAWERAVDFVKYKKDKDVRNKETKA
jgi:hypothetical protein